MVILGIDPGLATLGWGVIGAQPGRQRLIEYGCILTTPDQRFPERLRQIGEDMRALLQERFSSRRRSPSRSCFSPKT